MNTTVQSGVSEGEGHVNAMPQNATREGDKPVNNHRRAAVLAGIFYIMATVTAIVGLYMYQPILTGPDYLIAGAANAGRVSLGAFMELLLACSAIGTATVLFPVLRPHGERIALGYYCCRFMEAAVITVGIISVLSLLTLSQDFVAAVAPDAAAYHVGGTVLHAIYRWAFAFGPLIMLGINTSLYSYLLFKSKLVPQPLAALGLAGAALVLVSGLLVLFGVATQLSMVVVLLSMPVAVYEMILAGWLIVKGFNVSASAAQPVATTTNELVTAA